MSTPLTLTKSLPFGKIILVTLPNGRTWWTALNEFEVLFQVRHEVSRDSTLILDLAQYLTVTMDDADTIRIVVSMTGEETRTVVRSGHYDVIISDPGTIDARAKKILEGTFTIEDVVTAEVVAP